MSPYTPCRAQQQQQQQQQARTPGNVAMLGVGAGLAAALGLRHAKYSHEEAPAPAPAASATSRSQPAGGPALLTGTAGPRTSSASQGVAASAGASNYKQSTASTGAYASSSTAMAASSSAAYRGRSTAPGIALADMDDGDDVEAALKAAAKRAASAGPSAAHTTNTAWLATPGAGSSAAAALAAYHTGYAPAPAAAARPGTADAAVGHHSRAKSVPARPASATMRGGGATTAQDSTDDADVMGEEDSAEGAKTGDVPAAKHKAMVNVATVSSVTAGSSPGHGDGTSAPMTEEEIRAMHRQREYEQRQRLKQYVASPEFDGKSNTDFYGFGKVLGQGSFGKVRLAWHRLAGAKVAIKSYEKSKLTEPNHWRRVQQEIRCV